MVIEAKVDEPGLMLQVSKQTAMTGEVISVSTNLPKGWSKQELALLIDDITWAIDKRMEAVNDKVLERTGKSLEQYLTHAQPVGEA